MSARRLTARFRYMWASCSQVNPMPPCSCTVSFAHRTKPSSARATATAAGRVAVVVSAAARAASHAVPRACSVVMSMSASLCFTAWNWPIGRPNCSRTFA